MAQGAAQQRPWNAARADRVGSRPRCVPSGSIGPGRVHLKPWAKTYKDRAERLIATGRMQPAGLESIHLAKASGAWEAMNDVDMLVAPDDLRAGLETAPGAFATFEAFPPSTRRNILRWIGQAKTPSTRSKRIERVTLDAHAGIRTKSNG